MDVNDLFLGVIATPSEILSRTPNFDAITVGTTSGYVYSTAGLYSASTLTPSRLVHTDSDGKLSPLDYVSIYDAHRNISVIGGYQAGGYFNIRMGAYDILSHLNDVTVSSCTAIGRSCLNAATTALNSLAIGAGNMNYGLQFTNCVCIGQSSNSLAASTGVVCIGSDVLRGYPLTPGTGSTNVMDSIFIGDQSGYYTTQASRNVYIGTYSGRAATGSSNVFLGYAAGYNETGSNKLYISNSSTQNLITGDFKAQTLSVNGALTVTNLAGVGTRYVQADAAGLLSTATLSAQLPIILSSGIIKCSAVDYVTWDFSGTETKSSNTSIYAQRFVGGMRGLQSTFNNTMYGIYIKLAPQCIAPGTFDFYGIYADSPFSPEDGTPLNIISGYYKTPIYGANRSALYSDNLHVGVAPSGTPTAGRIEAGSLQLSGLAGVGTRFVETDANGLLSTIALSAQLPIRLVSGVISCTSHAFVTFDFYGSEAKSTSNAIYMQRMNGTLTALDDSKNNLIYGIHLKPTANSTGVGTFDYYGIYSDTPYTSTGGQAGIVASGSFISPTFGANRTALHADDLYVGITPSGTPILGRITAGSITLTTPLGETYGGTGKSSYAVGDILYADTTTTLAKLTKGTSTQFLRQGASAPGWVTLDASMVAETSSKYFVSDSATGYALIGNGVGVTPTWGKIGLSTHISGTLAVTNGGTGFTACALGQVIVGSGTNTIAPLTLGTAGQLLRVKTDGTTVQYTSLLGTSNQVTVTSNTGNITLSLPQNIHTAATPQFASIVLSDNLISGTGATTNTRFGYLAGYNAGGAEYGTYMGYGAGWYMTGTGNCCYGVSAGQSTPYNPGQYNSYFGYRSAMAATNGNYNIGIGANALYSVSGSNNVGIGKQALQGITTASDTIAIGTAAGLSLTTGSTGEPNVFIGANSGYGITTTGRNTAVGSYTLSSAGGSINTCVGYQSMQQLTGNYNCGFGYLTLGGAVNSASQNTAIGYACMRILTTGGDNVGLGYQCLYNLTTGTRNVCLGYTAGTALTTESNKLIIDNGATGTSFISGDFSARTLTIDAALTIPSATIGSGGSTLSLYKEYTAQLVTVSYSGTTNTTAFYYDAIIIGKQVTLTLRVFTATFTSATTMDFTLATTNLRPTRGIHLPIIVYRQSVYTTGSLYIATSGACNIFCSDTSVPTVPVNSNFPNSGTSGIATPVCVTYSLL